MIGVRSFEAQICEALGLKEVTKLTIRFEVGKHAVVEAEMLVFDDDTAEKFLKVIKQYTLVEKEQ